MKSHLTILRLIAFGVLCSWLLIASSCDKREIEPEEMAIGFSTNVLTDSETKATTVSGTTLPASTYIGVIGIHCPSGTWDATQKPWFMHNIAMSSDGSTYKNASDTKYWPIEGALRFFAYYPYTNQSDVNKVITLTSSNYAGYPKISVSCSNHQNEHVDLLVAKTDMATRTASVPLTFSHTSLRIAFAANTSATTQKAIILNEIYLKGVKNSGVYNFETDTWSIGTETDNITCIDGSFPLATSVTPITSESEYTLVLPQPLTNVVLEVHYTINNTHFIRSMNLSTTEAETPWTKGKSITYTLTISPSDESLIVLCTVNDWIAHTINIPLT